MTAALHTVRSWLTGDLPGPISRLVKVDLVVAAIALAVIITVTAVDHAAQGSFSALAGLVGG